MRAFFSRLQRHDIAVGGHRRFDDVVDIFEQVEEVQLLRAGVGLVHQVGRVAGLHGGLHLGGEIAEVFGVDGRDIQRGALAVDVRLDRFAELGFDALEVLLALQHSQLAGAALGYNRFGGRGRRRCFGRRGRCSGRWGSRRGSRRGGGCGGRCSLGGRNARGG